MKLYDSGVYLVNGTELVADDAQAAAAIKSRTGREVAKAEAAQGTIAYGILKDHNESYRQHVHRDWRSSRFRMY